MLFVTKVDRRNQKIWGRTEANNQWRRPSNWPNGILSTVRRWLKKWILSNKIWRRGRKEYKFYDKWRDLEYFQWKLIRRKEDNDKNQGWRNETKKEA